MLSKVDLLATDFEIKVADLGLSKYVANSEMPNLTMCGTPLYMSPQIVKRNDYTSKTDIWSLGVLLFEMLTGETPFHS